MGKIINWRELSRTLSGNDNSIRSYKCPKKYKANVLTLLWFVTLWSRWVEKNEKLEVMTNKELKGLIKSLSDESPSKHPLRKL